MFSEADFPIRLSKAQEQIALKDHQRWVESMEPVWKAENASPEFIQKEKVDSLIISRLKVYGIGCMSKIYRMLRGSFGEEFAQFAYKLDRGLYTVEGAKALTDLVIKIPHMLSQGANKEAIQQQLNPLNSQYWEEKLELSEQRLHDAQAQAAEADRQRQEEAKLRQQTEEENTGLKRKLEALYAQGEGQSIPSVEMSFGSSLLLSSSKASLGSSRSSEERSISPIGADVSSLNLKDQNHSHKQQRMSFPNQS